MIAEEGILIPTPGAKYANLNPSLTRFQNSLISTDRRINQGADQINQTWKTCISETRDSQEKCVKLIPEFRRAEQTREQPKKPKVRLDLFQSDTGSCPLFGGKSSTIETETYRNIMQAAALVHYDRHPRSITYTDFKPKVLYPFDEIPTKAKRSLEPKSPEWMKFRKQVSQFADLEIPKRYGTFKFMDDTEPSR